MFPVDEQAKLSSEISKAEAVDFINYFLCLHKYVDSCVLIVYVYSTFVGLSTDDWIVLNSKKQEDENLASVVADLRQASLPAIRFIAETLLLLEVPSCVSVVLLLCGCWPAACFHLLC